MYQDPDRSEGHIPADRYRVEDMGPEVRQPKQKKKRIWPKVLCLCLVCTFLGCAGGAAVGIYTLQWLERKNNTATLYESDRAPTEVEVIQTTPGQELSLEEIYASWVNSTVGITTEIVTTNLFGQPVSAGAAAGSGFVISEDGYIVTNHHVIEGASSVKVTFYDAKQYDAVVVGSEKSNDIAVLKIEAENLTPVILGNSDNLHVGQTVTAIGNPLGELTFSQSAGIVSAKDRAITLSDGQTINMIQTDCTINSGNSGGPLFNTYGEVVGITSAKYSNNGSYAEATIEGIGFAIPMNDVAQLIQDIVTHGYVTGKPNVGVLLGEVDEGALRYGIPDGAVVEAVLEGACADRAGLREGDIITAVDDVVITGVSQLQSILQNHRAGDTVTFTVYRDGQILSLPITLDERNQARVDALEELKRQYSAQQQPVQPPSDDVIVFPDFGFGWPFGW